MKGVTLLTMDNRQRSELKKLGLKIAYYRKLNELSQEKFSEMINISRTHMSRIETGESAPSIITLINISTELNIPIKDLFDY